MGGEFLLEQQTPLQELVTLHPPSRYFSSGFRIILTDHPMYEAYYNKPWAHVYEVHDDRITCASKA